MPPDAPAPSPTHPALPPITPENEDYWRGGSVGELRIRRCQACGHWIEGPSPLCPECWSTDVVPEATSGRGFVYTYSTTYNTSYEAFGPAGLAVALPYTTAIVELDEQPALRITTNLVGCPAEDVAIGLRVHVVFEQSGPFFIPLFEPDGPDPRPAIADPDPDPDDADSRAADAVARPDGMRP